MKVKDLQKYKPLDITEITGTPWNTAEKVLGLNEQDKVVMAETTEIVTPEDVDNAITEAMEAETARTESAYVKNGALDDYATKDYVDDAISHIDLEDYYTKEETDAAITGATADLPSKAWVTGDTASRIDTAIASETARTENTYAKKSEIPDLDNYYTKSETDEAIEEAISGISLEGYWTSAQTKNYVDAEITGATASETARTENVYAKKSDIPSLDDYYTKAQTDAEITGATVDMATKTWVGEQGYLTEHQSLAGLFDDARYVSSSKTINFYDKTDTLVATIDATDFIKDGMVDNVYISGSTLVISFNTDAGQEDITINLTDIFNPANYYDKTAIDGIIATETARTDGAYVKISVMPKFLKNVGIYYDEKEGKTFNVIGFVFFNSNNGQYSDFIQLPCSSINGVPAVSSTFGLPGGASAITLPTFEDVSTAITESMETETARTESIYAKKSEIPSLDGYWTSAQTENAITAATEDMATKTWVGQQGYLTQHQDISGKLDVSVFTGYTGATETVLEGKADISDIPDVSDFVTSGEVATQIDTAMAAETARTESTYLKEHQDISGKLDKTDFNTYTGATETALAGKVDLTTYTAYTGSTATAIAAKQDTLVSGTNIKTINNQSLLGSGNIDIQGGGGGGGSVVELTKAQYDALNPPAADTTYIITDAETVDLNDYAMASGLTELSGTVETLSSTKADKQNVTARASNSNYLPGWNAQGVITGSTAYYNKSQGINGTNYNVFSNSNTNHPAIFAPTSAGTAGQPLLSNGSGAPVWGTYKFAFISQSQYDALTTPDATTIYFIVDPN